MIYLDSAATTLQKPPAVPRAVCHAMGHMASPGRGGHRPAMLAAETAFACRQAAAALFGLADPERVVFTMNATHGLNLAIKSLVKPGDKVLISGYEHNAVVRPLACMEGVEVVVATAPLFAPDLLYGEFEARLTPEIKAVVCNHVSNVFGYILPAERIAALCKDRGVPFILDASQSAGCLPISMETLGAAFIAMPGHKGLYGPQGTGLLLCGEAPTRTLLEGGTGSLSALRTMPEFLPDRLEAGTHNIPGIAGLLAGIRFVAREGPEHILSHERQLLIGAVDGLERLERLRLFAANCPGRQAGVLSFQIEGMDCEAVGEGLGAQGIAVRCGLHCAPLAHESAGTLAAGTVRASFSAFNTMCEIRQFVHGVAQMARAV
ncbi:MAG: aminotransferase class V-fold PLP-dependent enzyme [Pseudoflavonifractor sp.]